MLLLGRAVFGACRRLGGVLPVRAGHRRALVGASLSLSPRPHLVSFLFLAITLHAWLGTARDLRPRWWLLALSWVWACSHGMWLLGPMVGLAVIGGLLLERRLPTGRLARLLAVPVGSVVAAALTPAGPGLVLVPFTTRGTSQQYIAEWGVPVVPDDRAGDDGADDRRRGGGVGTTVAEAASRGATSRCWASRRPGRCCPTGPWR